MTQLGSALAAPKLRAWFSASIRLQDGALLHHGMFRPQTPVDLGAAVALRWQFTPPKLRSGG